MNTITTIILTLTLLLQTPTAAGDDGYEATIDPASICYDQEHEEEGVITMDGTCWGPTRHAQEFGEDIDVSLNPEPDNPYTFTNWYTDALQNLQTGGTPTTPPPPQPQPPHPCPHTTHCYQ